jgi:hypothetical protein
MATLPAPIPQLRPRQFSQSESRSSNCQEVCTNLNGRAFAEDDSTALHEYRKRSLDLASESHERSPLQGTPELSRTTYVPLAVSEPFSPGSTVENTEEEHKAAIEFCLSLRSISSVERHDDGSPHGFTHERSDERSSERICTTGLARKHSEKLGGVEATVIECEHEDEPDPVHPCEITSRTPKLSALHTEDHDSSQTDTLPGSPAKFASAKTYLEESEQYGSNGNLPPFRLLNSVSGSVDSVIQTLASTSMRSSYTGKDTSDWKTRPMTLDQDLENEPDSQCADIRLSQAIKCNGAFLDPHQMWCPVPGNWEDAVAFSEDMQRRTAQQQS